ncbi:MAG: hypothetical protein KF861_06770 [Planctomycetaceae bacterium]|nr:hypothetical protein [Planctomycetaceae bacterium]
MRILQLCGLIVGAGVWLSAVAEGAETEELLQQIKSVGPQGEGHRAAQRALRELMQADAAALLPILEACDDANPLAMNWLRGAFETLADRTLASGGELPGTELEAFVRDRSHAPRGRRLAYDWLCKVDPSAPDRLIPGMLDDPSEELRRDAVARLIAAAEQAAKGGEGDAATQSWRKALGGAVDEDQVNLIVAGLKEQGEEVDLVQHFGLLTEWKLIGPFDNKDMKGFDVAYPPEKELSFQSTYEGQLGPVQWQPYRSDKPDGLFDIGELVFNHKGSAMYAASAFSSPAEQVVEFRLATPNAWKLWLNGELLFAREEYHRGMFFDQYRVQGKLKPGENVLLFKVLQNEQEQDWAQDYEFKFRVTDLSGRAILSSDARRAAQSTSDSTKSR